MRSKQIRDTFIAVLAVLGAACSSGSDGSAGTGGAGTSGGSSQKGGAAGGESKASTGGQSATGGSSSSQAVAGSSGAGSSAGTGGSTGKGGTSATGAGGTSKTGGTSAGGGAGQTGGSDAGARATGGTTGGGGTSSGGLPGQGGSTGSGSTGNPDAGNKDATGPEGGTGGGSGGFAPCPASGACKILPLGDSITYGVNYDGGYRVKLFTSAITDKKDITYVGKLSNGPSTAGGTNFPKNNEGHNGWTIQQIDDIVTGKSSDASYSGKKLMTDLAPNIVLMHLGTNDTSRSPTGMPDRLGTLIDHVIADAPNALLVVSTIIPIKQGSYGTVGESFNKEVPGVVQKRIDAGKHVILVDMFKSFPSAGLSNDGVHPNQQGYDWMAGVWYEAIKSYLH